MLDVNWVGVFWAVVVSMVIGFVWYSVPVFGKTWMGLVGKKEADLKHGASQAYVVTTVAGIVQAYILAQAVQFASAVTVQDGAQAAFWLWLGFVASTSLTNVAFEGRPWKLWAINAGYFLVVMVIQGAILATLA